MTRLLLSRLLALSLILVAAVVGARGKGRSCTYWPAGLELDARACASANYPLNEDAWAYDSDFPEVTEELAHSRAKYYDFFFRYLMDPRQMPPGRRVICGLVMPNPSGTAKDAADIAAYASVSLIVETPPDPESMANQIVNDLSVSPYCDP